MAYRSLFMKKYLAEVLGTFAIVFCGTGAIIINEETSGLISHAGVAATFGLIVAAMIYILGDTSGAHFNPAVSLAFWAEKKFPGKEILPYVLSQSVGACLASFILHFLVPTNQHLGATLPGGPPLQSFLLEILLSFLLMLTILKVARGSKEKGMFAGLVIGAVIFLEALLAGPFCGASMNPARSLGPALASGQLQHLWIYLTAPFVGTLCAVLTWKVSKH
jgi:aquaporin Z